MSKKNIIKLMPRLEKTASLVRPDAVFADIGCDHGHLAIELIHRGALRGYACDINEGPLHKAQENILNTGLSDRIETILTNGLDGLEGKGITDITIAGIGGEIITDILQRAEWIKNPSIRIILQPQSRENILRSFLAEAGFSVFSEEAVRSGKYIYTVMGAEYTGISRKLSVYEAFSGQLPNCRTPESAEKLWRTAGFMSDTAEGLRRRGQEKEALELRDAAEQMYSTISTLPDFPH